MSDRNILKENFKSLGNNVNGKGLGLTCWVRGQWSQLEERGFGCFLSKAFPIRKMLGGAVE
jgi:hypothetical protein